MPHFTVYITFDRVETREGYYTVEAPNKAAAKVKAIDIWKTSDPTFSITHKTSRRLRKAKIK